MLMVGCAGPREKKTSPAVIETEPPVEQAVVKDVVVPADGWVFEKQAIMLRVQSSDDLNIFQDRAHTLIIGICQLSDPNTFNSMRSTREGLQELLSKSSFDVSGGIVAVEKRVIRPDRTEVIILDRAESAKYLGIAAGYFELVPERVSYILKIPPVQDRKVGFDKVNPLADPPPPRPGRLRIWIELGKDRIENIETDAD